MDIPALVSAAVEAAGSVSELARRLGVSRQAVHAWISGAAEPRGRHLVDLIGQIPEKQLKTVVSLGIARKAV